jgi:hypothetical protein
LARRAGRLKVVLALACLAMLKACSNWQRGNTMAQNQDWKPLYRVGAIAALVAALLFRRNIGAEVSLFTGVEAIPYSAADWYSLLQTNPFVGLSFLAVFDLINYAMEGLIFLALGMAFWQANKSTAALALTSGLLGIAVSFAANISLTMLSLSQQYLAASPEAQKAALLAAGQSLLATNNPLDAWPGTGPYISLLLIAVGGMLFSVLMFRSKRTSAVVGLLASGCDLAYCLTFAWVPFLQVFWMASGGLFWMIWHLLVARILFKRWKECA